MTTLRVFVSVRSCAAHKIAAALLALLGNACSPGPHAAGGAGDAGDAAGGADGGCVAYESDADLTSPQVSFNNDVLPLLEANCGIGSTCHGGNAATAIAQRGVFLGCVPNGGTCDGGDPAPLVYAGLIGPDASQPEEESCMPFVAPGNPSGSYLMHKVDDDLCTVHCCIATNAAAQSVSGTGCGSIMPYLGTILSADQRDTLRRWIAQGAMNR